MFLSPVKYCEINLENKFSYGIHELLPILVNKYELTVPLTILINQSLEEGVFLRILKTDILKSIHKKDEKHNPCNSRSIDLLPTLSKIFEKAMTNRVY